MGCASISRAPVPSLASPRIPGYREWHHPTFHCSLQCDHSSLHSCVCVRVTPQAFRQLWQDCDWLLIVNEDFLFYQYTSLSAETYTPGPAVPDMTQIAIFSTASALNHTSVWWTCHCHALSVLAESHLPFVSPSSGIMGFHLCFHGKWQETDHSANVGVWTELSQGWALTPAALGACANWVKKTTLTFNFFFLPRSSD